MSTKPFSFEEAQKPVDAAAAPTQPEPFSFEAATGEAPKRGFGGWARDVAATAVKGAIAVPEMVVGLADIPTGGRVGKFLENEGGAVGFRPKEAKELVNDWHSDATKEAQRKFQEADGFWDKAATAVQNPSLIATAVGESIPSMLAGGVMGRGALAAARGLGFAATPAATAAGAALATKQATIAGAAGEGLSMAGSAAEQIRQETEDGFLTPMQSGAALLTGAAGGVISRLSGGLQNKLGIGDADTMAVQGLGKAASPGAAAAVNPLVQQTAARSIPNQVVLGAINEGLLEELPQSLAEQMLQNVALGKPWHQDLDAAAIMGTLSGGVMGAGAAGLNAYRNSGAPAQADPNNPGQPGQPDAEAEPQPSPGMQAMRAEYEARLADLQAQEQGEASVRQTNPPDGRAIIEAQQAIARAERGAAMAAGRTELGPDDEIHQSTGATDLVRQMVKQAADAGGALSSAAVVAIDTGAAGQMQQAADQAQAQAVAQEQAKAGKKADPAAKVDASTGEIAGGAMASWSDDQLSSAFRGAQDRNVRIQIANELQRRRTEREQADLQAELQDEQATMAMPDLPDNAFASVSEDAGEAPADLFIDEPATRSPAPRKGNSNGTQATQAQQAEPKQPAQPANSTAKGPAFAGSARQGEAVGQPVPQPGALTNAAPTPNNGAQAATAPGPQTQAGGEATAPAAATEALRTQLREVEDKILRAAPGAMAAGGGDIEAAMKSPKVPVTLKAKRKKLKDQLQAAQPAGESGDGIKLTPAQKREIEAGGTGFVGELGESARSSLQAMRNNPKVPVIKTDANGSYFNDELPQYTDIGSGFSVRGYSVRGDVVQDIKLPNGMVIQRKLKADGSVTGSAEGNYDQIVEGKGFAEAEKLVADYFAGRRPEAQTRALPAPKVEAADAPKSGYTLPDGDINHEWRDAKGRETQHPDFEPTARQQILMDAVGKVLDAGAFYSDDVNAKLAEMLGVSKDVLASNRTGVQGGDFGYDVYLASRALETKRATKNSEKIARELNLSVGDTIGTLMFLDFKVTTGVTITSKNDTGLIYGITGKRGAAVLNAEVGVDNLKGAIERAHERGKRKDSYADFIASRKAQEAAAQPAPKKPSRSVLAKLKEQARAEHFAPGNVIASYGGGHDRVVSYQPSDERGNWSVTVRAVQKQGDTWVDVPNERERTHSTQPDAKELTRGPVGKVEVVAASEPEMGAAPQAVSDDVAVNEPNSETAYADGQLLGAGDLLGYFDKVVASSEKGGKVANPRFLIGEVGQAAAKEIAKYIDGYDGQQRRLRVSGRTIKHIHESRPAIAREIVEQLPGMFTNPDEVLPDHKHAHQRALLVKGRNAPEGQSKPKSYVATVEVEIEVEVSDGFIDIVTIMTAPDRSLREARELKKNWPEGQQRTEQAVNSPHPLTSSKEANPAAEFPDARPVEPSVSQGHEDAQAINGVAGSRDDGGKLTQAEAKALMEWQDMGQTGGVKKHALHFYESQADKDTRRGRMTLVNVTKDTSASNWFVEGDDKPFAMLGMAKKRAEELGMLRAIADGFVEGGAEKAGADAGAKWDAMTPSQRASMLDKWAGAGLTDMGARYKDRAWSSFNVGERGTLASVINGANEAADEPAAGTKTDEQKAYQDSFEMPSQSVLAKKPTPASIDNWSNPVEWHGKTAYTNGHFVDVTGTPPHLKDWESRKGVRQNLTTSMTDRVLGMAGVRDGFPDSSHVKADPLAVIDDAKSGRLFFDVQGELVSIDLKYARYFHSKVKGVTFTANPKDLGGPLRVMDGDNLVGIVMPFRPTIYDKSAKMTVADVRGYMASSGKDKPQSVVKRAQQAKEQEAKPAETPAEDAADVFPMQEAASSYSGISHSGTQRAKSDAAEFEAYIERANAAGLALAETDKQKAAVEQATKSLRADYLAAYRRMMGVRSGTYSGFVAGRSGLNAKQADRRNSAYDRAIDEFVSWQKENDSRVRRAALDARTDEAKQADIDAARAADDQKAQAKEDAELTLMRKILNWKKGGEPVAIGKAINLNGVNLDKAGYPSSVKLSPTDGSTLSDDKFDLAALFRRKGMSVPDSKRRVRELVDAVRAEDGAQVAAAKAAESDSLKSPEQSESATTASEKDIREAVTVDKNAIAPESASGKELRAMVSAWAKAKWGDGNSEDVKNPRWGGDITITWQGIKHAISNANEPELRLIAGLSELIGKAAHVESHPDKRGRNDVKAVHTFSVKAKLGGEALDVGIVVRELKDGHKFYDHFIIKSETPSGISGAASSVVSDGLGTPASDGVGPSVSEPTEVNKPANPVIKAKASPRQEAIADVGEKIGGARKDVWSGFKDDLKNVSDDDIKSEPLSKIWPAPDYAKLIDAGTASDTVSMLRAMRDHIPTKPKASYRLRTWVGQVKALREFATEILDGKVSAAALKEEFRLRALSEITGRAELYEAVGHAKSLDGITLQHHHYTLYKGRENVSLWAVEMKQKASAFSNWPREIATGDTKEQAIEAFKKAYDSLGTEKSKSSVSFDIISDRKTGEIFVAKKLGRNFARLAGPFKTVKEARAHRDANQADLEKTLERFKEIPSERADQNRPRVGQDMRNGQDITPDEFREAFGFRGVEFGNWVEQKRRQEDLNNAFDALMDMAAVLGLPPKSISLNGQLGLAFGARGGGGKGAAAAHYEPTKVVINLTKREGAGSLGHEWWHAVDNYFSRMRKEGSGFLSTAPDVSLASSGSNYVHKGEVRKEMVDAFGAVMKAINTTAMKARSAKLDGKRTKEYWGTGEELSARAFESYLISKLQDQNAANDYLANVVDQKTWDAMAALGMENEDSYPYPTAGEVPLIRGGFDHFFSTIEAREGEGGNIKLFRTSRAPGSTQAQLSLDAVKKTVESALRRVVGAPTVQVVARPEDIGLGHPFTSVPKGVTLNDGSVVVFSDGAESVVDVYRTVFHELFHRGSKVRFERNSDYITKMLTIAAGDETVRAEVASWKKSDDGLAKMSEFRANGPLTGERLANYEAIAVEEALATMAERIGMGELAQPQGVIKRIARFLARVADAWGMTQLSHWLRNQSTSETEKFVMETIAMSGGKANTFSTALLFNTSQSADTQELADLFKALEAPRGLKLTQAYRAVDQHPLSSKIREVESNFLDIIERLDDAGLVQINC